MSNGIFSANELRQAAMRDMNAQFSAARSPYEKMGLAVGNLIGGALGVRDPRLEQASQIQAIYNQVSSMGLDPSSPQFFKTLATQFSAAGLGDQAMMSAQRAQEVESKIASESRAERGVALQEERLALDKQKVEADIAREARQGRLTEAQIREINARINNMGSNYEYQVVKGPMGEITSIVAINKKNPSDVKQIPLGDSAPPPAAAGSDMSAQAKAELERRRNAK